MNDIGLKVKKRREEKGWSQDDLAKRIGGSVKQQNIQQLEDGTVKQPRYLNKLATVLDMSYTDLLGNSPDSRVVREPESNYGKSEVQRLYDDLPENDQQIFIELLRRWQSKPALELSTPSTEKRKTRNTK